ncbi:MAG: hypothetical protein JWL70_3001, partial [Acidimicrobiia bacterium]|nr:hypothetical protein [Acidimicrobiia bacterium]
MGGVLGEGHLRCPYCAAYEVDRMFLAATRLDSCACRLCGALLDEDSLSGVFR